MTVDWTRPWLCKHVKFAILSLRLSLARAVARGRAPRRSLVSIFATHNRHNRECTSPRCLGRGGFVGIYTSITFTSYISLPTGTAQKLCARPRERAREQTRRAVRTHMQRSASATVDLHYPSVSSPSRVHTVSCSGRHRRVRRLSAAGEWQLAGRPPAFDHAVEETPPA